MNVGADAGCREKMISSVQSRTSSFKLVIFPFTIFNVCQGARSCRKKMCLFGMYASEYFSSRCTTPQYRLIFILSVCIHEGYLGSGFEYCLTQDILRTWNKNLTFELSALANSGYFYVNLGLTSPTCEKPGKLSKS